MSKRFELYPYEEGMRIKMKKTHPCGGDVWSVMRVGADVKLCCETCRHELILSRRKLEQATKAVLLSPGDL